MSAPPPANTTVVKENNAPPPANTTVVQEGGAAQAGGAAPAGAPAGGAAGGAAPANTTVVEEKKGSAAAGSGPPTSRRKFILFGPRRAARSDVEANRDTNPKLVRNMSRGRLCRLLTFLMLLGFLLSLLWPLAFMAAMGSALAGPGGLKEQFNKYLARLNQVDKPKPTPTPTPAVNDTLIPASTLTGPVAIQTPVPADDDWTSYIMSRCDFVDPNGNWTDSEMDSCFCNFEDQVCDSPPDADDTAACEWLYYNDFDFDACFNATAASTSMPFITTFTTTNYAATVTVPSTTRTVTTLMSASVTTSTAWFELPPGTSYVAAPDEPSTSTTTVVAPTETAL